MAELPFIKINSDCCVKCRKRPWNDPTLKYFECPILGFAPCLKCGRYQDCHPLTKDTWLNDLDLD